MATRVASSGVMSTLARPATPVAPEQRCGRRGDSHTIEELMTAPGLDRLERVHLHAGAEHGVLADEALVAEHHALLAADAAAQVAGPADRSAPRSRTPSPR